MGKQKLENIQIIETQNLIIYVALISFNNIPLNISPSKKHVCGVGCP